VGSSASVGSGLKAGTVFQMARSHAGTGGLCSNVCFQYAKDLPECVLHTCCREDLASGSVGRDEYAVCSTVYVCVVAHHFFFAFFSC